MRTAPILTAAAVAIAGVFTAPAVIAPADTPQLVTQKYHNDGYQVNIDRVGAGPLDECVVTGVRNPQTITQTIPITRGKRKYYIEKIVSRTISVSLDCSR